MIDDAELKLQLGNRRPTWELLAQLGASVSSAAPMMRCSRRTALSALKAASIRLEQRKIASERALDLAITQTHLKAAVESSWPESFSQLADRIKRDGQASVSAAERRNAVASLPRGISVANAGS